MATDVRGVLEEISAQLAAEDERLADALREKGLDRENLRAFARGEHLCAKYRKELQRAAQRLDEELEGIARPAPTTTAIERTPRPAPSWLRA